MPPPVIPCASVHCLYVNVNTDGPRPEGEVGIPEIICSPTASRDTAKSERDREITADTSNPNLAADTEACWVVKDELVDVEFAAHSGVLRSAVGMNRYEAGDALVTGSTGDCWCVSRARFDAKYRPDSPTCAGQSGRYRNLPAVIRAKQMAVAFRVARSAGGDVLQGIAGDWLVQYAPGDYGVVARARFEAVYQRVATPT